MTTSTLWVILKIADIREPSIGPGLVSCSCIHCTAFSSVKGFVLGGRKTEASTIPVVKLLIVSWSHKHKQNEWIPYEKDNVIYRISLEHREENLRTRKAEQSARKSEVNQDRWGRGKGTQGHSISGLSHTPGYPPWPYSHISHLIFLKILSFNLQILSRIQTIM